MSRCIDHTDKPTLRISRGPIAPMDDLDAAFWAGRGNALSGKAWRARHHQPRRSLLQRLNPFSRAQEIDLGS